MSESSSPSNARARRSISSTIGWTSATGLPAGSSRSQSRYRFTAYTGQASPQPMVRLTSALRAGFVGPGLGELLGHVEAAVGEDLGKRGVDVVARRIGNDNSPGPRRCLESYLGANCMSETVSWRHEIEQTRSESDDCTAQDERGAVDSRAQEQQPSCGGEGMSRGSARASAESWKVTPAISPRAEALTPSRRAAVQSLFLIRRAIGVTAPTKRNDGRKIPMVATTAPGIPPRT